MGKLNLLPHSAIAVSIREAVSSQRVKIFGNTLTECQCVRLGATSNIFQACMSTLSDVSCYTNAGGIVEGMEGRLCRMSWGFLCL